MLTDEEYIKMLREELYKMTAQYTKEVDRVLELKQVVRTLGKYI